MSDNKKYYYLKMKENFFDTPEMIVLESMQDGFMYSNILVKLYLKAIKFEGRLMFNERIPYNCNMIATVTRHQVGTVEKAFKIFEQLGLIDVISADEIYMADMQAMIGHTTSEAIRKKEYRDSIKEKKQISGTLSQNRPPELELKLEKEKEKEKDIYIVNDARIDWFSECYLGYTGKKYRKVKKDIQWNEMLEDISKEEFIELVCYFLEDDKIKSTQMTIEYFNTVVDRYR